MLHIYDKTFDGLMLFYAGFMLHILGKVVKVVIVYKQSIVSNMYRKWDRLVVGVKLLLKNSICFDD